MRARTPILLLAAFSCLAACARQPAAPGPDIILVSIESLRPDHLGCYGYKKPTSPTIDALASHGVRCETAVSTTSWTLPAHAAMFTGLFDSTHGVVDNGLRLSEAHRTLAEALRASGWQTAGFYGGPYLDPVYGLAQGFEHWESCMGAELSYRDVTGPRTVAAVTRWLDDKMEKQGGRPFFLFLHLWDVHYDYVPPKEYAELFDPGYDGKLDASDLAHNAAIGPSMAPRDFQHLVALYDGEIRSTDDALGRILDELERRGRLANALVVVTADHGEEFFEHGGKGHQHTLFDEVVKVPLILRWPGRLPTASVVKEPVRLVDLMPTLLALAGVRERPPVQGRDVSPLLRGESMEPAPALLELLVDENDIRALRTDDRKVVSWRHARVTFTYDLVRDPREERPEPGDPASVDRMVEDAARFLARRPAETIEIGAELERRLSGLGYAGAGAAGKPPK